MYVPWYQVCCSNMIGTTYAFANVLDLANLRVYEYLSPKSWIPACCTVGSTISLLKICLLHLRRKFSIFALAPHPFRKGRPRHLDLFLPMHRYSVCSVLIYCGLWELGGAFRREYLPETVLFASLHLPPNLFYQSHSPVPYRMTLIYLRDPSSICSYPSHIGI